jgi:hypothetical protein
MTATNIGSCDASIAMFGLPCFARGYQYYIINLHEAANLELPEGKVHSSVKRLSAADSPLLSSSLPSSFILLLQTVPPTWLYIPRFPSACLSNPLSDRFP